MNHIKYFRKETYTETENNKVFKRYLAISFK